MSVYIDQLQDWGFRYGPSCHMIADTLPELHEMAKRVGMKRSWFQPKSFPHYDLVASRRAAALAAGAVEVNRHEFVMKMRALRESERKAES